MVLKGITSQPQEYRCHCQRISRTPLQIAKELAEEQPNYKRIIQLLLKKGASHNLRVRVPHESSMMTPQSPYAPRTQYESYSSDPDSPSTPRAEQTSFLRIPQSPSAAHVQDVPHSNDRKSPSTLHAKQQSIPMTLLNRGTRSKTTNATPTAPVKKQRTQVQTREHLQ